MNADTVLDVRHSPRLHAALARRRRVAGARGLSLDGAAWRMRGAAGGVGPRQVHTDQVPVRQLRGRCRRDPAARRSRLDRPGARHTAALAGAAPPPHRLREPVPAGDAARVGTRRGGRAWLEADPSLADEPAERVQQDALAAARERAAALLQRLNVPAAFGRCHRPRSQAANSSASISPAASSRLAAVAARRAHRVARRRKPPRRDRR